jgi:hypothetical protein
MQVHKDAKQRYEDLVLIRDNLNAAYTIADLEATMAAANAWPEPKSLHSGCDNPHIEYNLATHIR